MFHMSCSLFLGNCLKVYNMQHLAAQSFHLCTTGAKFGLIVLNVALQTWSLIEKVLKDFLRPMFLYPEFHVGQSGHSDMGGESTWHDSRSPCGLNWPENGQCGLQKPYLRDGPAIFKAKFSLKGLVSVFLHGFFQVENVREIPWKM